MRCSMTKFAALCAMPLAMGIYGSALGTLITFDLNVNFGTVNAGGDVIVTITEDSAANVDDGVHITVTNNTAGDLSDLFLNYDPPSDLATAVVKNFDDGSGNVTQPSVSFNGLQGFAIDFGYQTANNNAGRFGPGESVSFDLDANLALLVASFNELGGNPTGEDYYAAAHIISVPAVGTCTAGSAKVGDANGGNVAGGGNVTSCDDGGGGGGGSVPEPQTVALVGLGLLSLAFLRRRQRA